jgi:hypothetical protein
MLSTASGNVSFDTAKLGPGNYAAWMLFDDGYQLLGGPCAFSVRWIRQDMLRACRRHYSGWKTPV